MDENIILKYTGSLDYFETFIILIIYNYNITEPEIDIYNNYPENIEGDDDELFEHTQYVGRDYKLQIILGQAVSTNCENNNCNLCYKNLQY